MHNLAQPSILALATFTPVLGLFSQDMSYIAQQISAVGVMAFFLWRETKINRELRNEVKELQKTIVELRQQPRVYAIIKPKSTQQ